MSDNQAPNNTDTNQLDPEELKEVQNDPVLQGKSALIDPDLGGSTASSWTGTGGPDPGGDVTPQNDTSQGTGGASGG